MAKFTYIKHDISGYYIEFEQKFNPDLYNNLGSTFQDFLDNKWVLLSNKQVAFHNEHPNASVKEVWDMQLTPAPERTLEQAKAEMIQRINEYDSSSNVNGFTVNGTIDGWFTAEERSNYKSSIDAAKLVGIDKLTFFIGDMLMEIGVNDAEMMLAQIQLYADKCYIVTKGHKITVEELETIEEVDAFPFMEGYPTKLDFPYAVEVEE
jgi:hypothetical protein